MVFPVVGGTQSTGGYEISNSMRFNDANANRFQRTPSSGGSRRTFTYSCWVKLSDIGNRSALLHVNGGNNNNSLVEFVIHQNGYLFLGLQTFSVFETDMLFRDPSAWYHIVLRIDSTEGSSDNRVKLYVNGNRLDLNGISRANNKNSISQNFDFGVGVSGVAMAMGSTASGGDPIGGYMSEINFVDGAALGPDKFGETNDDGVWVPIEPDVSAYGTNGFFLEFKGTGFDVNSSGVGADTSGNDNHHGSTNFATDHITTDTPTNNFATFNPLDNYYQQYTYAEGNLKITTNADYYNWNTSTIGVTSGKWYVEAKATQVGTGSDNWVFGIAAHSPTSNNQGIGADNFSIGYRNNGNYKTGDSNNTHGAAFSEGDIVMIALDLDNDNVYFGSGGQWADGSGNTDEANPSSAVSLSNLRGSTTLGDTVFFAFGDWNSNASSTVSIGDFNFGNPPFSISSGNTDGKYGNFEYAPPSGYFALCTKNLANYG